jgi:aromatic-L-amino-acid/L-tryptophan decarboxylase
MTMEHPEEALEARLAALEAQARTLEEDPETRRRWGAAVLGAGESLVAGLAHRPAWDDGPGARAELLALGVPEEPVSLEVALDLFAREIDGPGLQPASPGHLGYIPGGGLYPSALGDYLAAVSNRYAGVAQVGPGAVALENMLLGWLRDLFGLPSGAHGTLTSGGSIATLMAFAAARDGCGIGAEEVRRSVIYHSAHTHHCVPKALALVGLGQATRRELPTERGRLVPSDLRHAIEEDRRAGLRPFLVVATAGTTDAGAIDPLGDIAAIAVAQQLWLHVDAAYGGAFALVEELRPRFAGIERADSLVVDPHKGLFLPYGSGALLVREPRHLAASHGRPGNYMQDVVELEDLPSPADLSPELSRHFRGLRLWLPLVLFGLRPFRAALLEKHLLARLFRERASALGYEVGPEPDLSVVLFRPRRQPEESPEAHEARQKELLARILADGRVFLSSTRLDGEFWLRAAILSFRTHRPQVEHLLEVLAR